MTQVALVTGAASGIGRACAEVMHGAGWHTAGIEWWVHIGDLPDGLQVYTVAVNWRFPYPDLYLGTDRGVYASKLVGGEWRPFGTGLPNTLVSDLAITPPGVVTAALYGRGAFQLRLPD